MISIEDKFPGVTPDNIGDHPEALRYFILGVADAMAEDLGLPLARTYGDAYSDRTYELHRAMEIVARCQQTGAADERFRDVFTTENFFRVLDEQEKHDLLSFLRYHERHTSFVGEIEIEEATEDDTTYSVQTDIGLFAYLEHVPRFGGLTDYLREHLPDTSAVSEPWGAGNILLTVTAGVEEGRVKEVVDQFLRRVFMWGQATGEIERVNDRYEFLGIEIGVYVEDRLWADRYPGVTPDNIEDHPEALWDYLQQLIETAKVELGIERKKVYGNLFSNRTYDNFGGMEIINMYENHPDIPPEERPGVTVDNYLRLLPKQELRDLMVMIRYHQSRQS